MDHGDYYYSFKDAIKFHVPSIQKEKKKQLSLTPLTYSGRVDILL